MAKQPSPQKNRPQAPRPGTPQRVNPAPAPAPVAAAPVKVKRVASPLSAEETLLHRKNYMLIGIGLGLVVLGFLLMSGGSMPDNDTWDTSRIYSFRRITLAPIVVLSGLITIVVAIFRK